MSALLAAEPISKTTPTKPMSMPTTASQARPFAGGTKGIDEHHPERNGRHQKRRETRCHKLFGPGHTAVAADQKKDADDCRAAPFHRFGARITFETAQRVKKSSGDEEADRRHQKWGSGLDGITDREIGRTPDQINND